MESKVKRTYDAALALKAPGAVAITATGVSAQVAINKITAGRGDVQGRFGEGSFDVVFHVVALDHTTGDETYSCAFNTYDINGANAVTHLTRLFVVAEVGNTYAFKFDTNTLGLEDPNAFFFGLNVTLAGTTPILQYWSFIAPNNHIG